MQPIQLPIWDPLGILSAPASKLAQKFIDEDIEFSDPVRDLIIDILDVDAEEGDIPADVNTAPPAPVGPVPQPQAPRGDISAPQSTRRSEYYQMGDRLISDSFTCGRNRAVAEQVASAFAQGDHRLQLECLHKIRDFTMYPETTEQFNQAKQWLEQHDLKDLLRQAYVDGL